MNRYKWWWVLILFSVSCSGIDDDHNSDREDRDTGNGEDIAEIEFPDDGCFYGEDTEVWEAGDWVVFLDSESGSWWVRTLEGERIIESPGSCPDLAEDDGPSIRFGDGEPYSLFAFGAFQIQMEGSRSEIDWKEYSGAAEVEIDGDQAQMLWGEGDIGLVFSLRGGRDLSIRLDGRSGGDIAGELNVGCRVGEAFFGLGTQVVGMDLRGRTYPLWTQEQGNGKNDDPFFPLENHLEAAYAPMGIWHSSHGYAALVGHDGYHELDLCDGDENRIRLRSYPDLPELILMAGRSPKDRMTAATDYIGRLDSVPDWVFGPWNDAVDGPERLWQVANSLRENDIPSSAIWSEDWIGGELTQSGFRLSYRWEWDEQTYPDLDEDIENLHEKGFAFLAYFNPFTPTTVPRYEEAVENGHLIEDEAGEVYHFLDPAMRSASLVDLSREETREWTKGYMVRAVEELGIDGWMADFAEWLPIDSVIGSGESPWRYHNRYPLTWQKVNRAAFQEARAGSDNWVYFARSGWASANGGTGGIAPTMWGGDQNTDWGFSDGMATIVPIGAHVGMSGVAIYGSDIAGYSSLSSENTSKELFLRWASIGTFHPLMRTHHGGDKCGNWFYDSDDETLQAYRRLARIHTLLFPYFSRLRTEAKEHGWPMVRHPYLVEGDDSRLWEGDGYQFFLGDDLLVAPNLKEGETTRSVALPAGEWWPLFGGESVSITSIEVDTVPGDIAVFMRGGKALGLLERPVDSFYGASAEGVTDLSDVDGAFRVGLFADEAGSIASTEIGESVISASGFDTAVDWRTATVDGESVELCDGDRELASAPCALEDRLLVQGSRVEVEVDGAEIMIDGEISQRMWLARGGTVWEEDAQGPEILDLDAEFISYCDE